MLDWGRHSRNSGIPIDVNAVDLYRRTPLHVAVSCGNFKSIIITGNGSFFNYILGLKDVVSLLLRNGANPNAKDDNGRTTLHELVRSINFSTSEEDKTSMLECLDVFLENDGKDNEPLDLEFKCSKGFSALNYAIFSGK